MKLNNFKFEKEKKPLTIQQIGKYLLSSNTVNDLCYATDLTLCKYAGKNIAARCRRYTYFEKYRDQFTIRYGLPTGNKTEYQKIMDGCGDWIFYGFLDETETRFIQSFIGDLNEFRRIVSANPPTKKMIRYNKDGTSFLVYDINYFHPGFFIVEDFYDGMSRWMNRFIEYHKRGLK